MVVITESPIDLVVPTMLVVTVTVTVVVHAVVVQLLKAFCALVSCVPSGSSLGTFLYSVALCW